MNDEYNNKYVLRARPMLNGINRFRREFCIGSDIWRETDFPGYFCTCDGRIAQIEFNEDFTLKKFLLMKIEHLSNNYQRVEIYTKKANYRKGIIAEKVHFAIHRIVYDTWKDYLQDGFVIDHKDTNPSNNNVSNLQQITQSENIQRAVDFGRFYQINNNKKKIFVVDTYTGEKKEYDSIKDFYIDIGAPKYMVKHGSISDLKKRKEYIRRYNVIFT